MKHYAWHGFTEFYVALGYRGEVIKRFFVEYANLNGNIRVDLARRTATSFDQPHEDWAVHLIDTGAASNTGGRLRRLRPWLGNETFLLTYGDGVSNLNIREVIDFHRAHGKVATLTAVRPPSRFGALEFDGEQVAGFTEKPQTGEGWINGGYMVLEPAIFDYLHGDSDTLEADALETVAAEGQLMAYRYDGFWQCMDTLRDKRSLEAMWQTGTAPWHVWK
jgi:glucose-1-phosphate cytidylyltransferase